MPAYRTALKTVTAATFLGLAALTPLAAQQTTLDGLYQELLDSDDTSHADIRDRIIAAWERSGSPAMDLLLRRGKDALDDGDPEAAIEHFTALIDHAPDFAEGYYGRASAYYVAGLIGPALADIEQVLDLNPRHFEAMTGLATIMSELGRPADALALLDQVLTIDPQSAQAQAHAAQLRRELEGQSL